MINKKEIFIIALIIIIISLSMGLSLNILAELKTVLYTFLAVSILILANVFTKKIIAYRLDSEIEMNIWEIGKYGFSKDKNSKKPFPFGAFLPIISKIVSIIVSFPFKSFVWMASLVFDVKPRIYRGAKRYGLYTFSEITESHLGLIAASGIVINLILAIVGYFLGFPLFARLNVYYAFFNMIPISELDGNKIFFGNLIIWGFWLP
jgi:Zn-dependent protease